MQNDKFFHRDLSWLSFNERVLQEAEDTSNPVYERLKFLAIFSSNLDEFYRVRVSKLRQFRNLQKDVKEKLNERPKKIIKAIQGKVDELQKRFGYVFENQITDELRSEGIYIFEREDFTPEQQNFSANYFKMHLKKDIKLYHPEHDEDLSFIKDGGMFLCVNAKDLVLIDIPTSKYERFVVLPSSEEGSYFITYLEEIIKDNLKEIDDGLKKKNAYAVKITRDGELYYDEYEGELVDLIKASLKQREAGLPTRLLYDFNMPDSTVKRLRKSLELNKTDLMPGGKFHNFSDFFKFPIFQDKLQLLAKDRTPLDHFALQADHSLIEQIHRKDELLCFPYQKYDYVPMLIEEAADNKKVTAINITLYRVSKDSAVAKALLKCLENDKKVTVFIEAKARFDEENNIIWGERLKEKGATVLYSMPEIKVHSKILLIEAEDNDVGYIGTGNFNEKSAKLYTDFALLTANEDITRDLKEVFKFLVNTEHHPKVKLLWMSPFTARDEICGRIDNEIRLAREGKKGALCFKMNSLEDEIIIEKLYEASKAGVTINLIVRGICRLIPQVEGLSEQINVVSIVGKYLEHSRVYMFNNDGEKDVFIASADCMKRNLDHRVEVATPILEKRLKKIVLKCLKLQWKDNVKGRIIDANNCNTYKRGTKKQMESQKEYYEFLRAKQLSKSELI
ncbi:MAG: polyphosphate kinase 1 [Bacteroidota bacterium]